MQYVLSGRSIDGTIYLSHHRPMSWSTGVNDAVRLSEEDVHSLLKAVRQRNDRVDPDLKIGRLRVLPAPKRRFGQWRKDKREERRHFGAVYDARLLGEFAHYENLSKSRTSFRRNPYPPGRRFDAWQDGYQSQDPLGDHHGCNR